MSMKNNLETFAFLSFFVVVVLGIPAYIFQYSLYSCVTFIIGLLVFAGAYWCAISIFPEEESAEKWNKNGVINLFIAVVFTFIYITAVDKFEENEINKFGIKTYGIIKSRVRSKSSNYFSVRFQNVEGNQFESKTYNNSYKLGDTLSVIYSERIREINRTY